jgi:uncharacterized membrane protein
MNMTEIIDIGLSIFRVIFGLLLILFIPGYAAIWALFPEKSQISLIERIAYSCVTSIGLTMVSILLLDLIIGVDTTPVNIVLTLILVTLFCGSVGILNHLLQPRLRIEHVTHFVLKCGETILFQALQRVKFLIRR